MILPTAVRNLPNSGLSAYITFALLVEILSLDEGIVPSSVFDPPCPILMSYRKDLYDVLYDLSLSLLIK
jgi:hypothetical protein